MTNGTMSLHMSANDQNKNLKLVYFGGEPLGVPVLEELKVAGLLPALVICNPDRPAGRGRILTAPPVKRWAEAHEIPVWQPENFTDQQTISEKLSEYDLFVVVAYNKILPQWLIEMPRYKTLNVHPSLLPLYRGASPIRTAILEDNRAAIGVSIMLMDRKMDHGPLLAQTPLPITDEHWPIAGPDLDEALACLGGATLAATIPEWIAGTIAATEQDHTKATYCGKLDKDMGELHIDPHHLPSGEAAQQAYLQHQAFIGFPGTFFFHQDERVKINSAQIKDGEFIPLTVTPAGKKPQDFTTWLKTILES